MLELRPTEKFSWTFDITQDGAPIGVLALTRFRSKGTITLGNDSYAIARESVFGPFVLTHSDRMIARAERESLVPARYHIVADDRQLILKSRWFRKAELLHGDVVIATMKRPNILFRVVQVETKQPLSTPVLILATAIMILLWRRRSRSNN
jgi:hypothetical protein